MPDGARGADQLDLHDGAFRRARLAGADAPARRHARPDGQAVRRDHREPDHLELQGRPVRARVLQLDPRRPQGPRRHRAQDRELRLSDAPSGRRGAGLHHHDRGLRHDGRHQGARHHRLRARSWPRSPAASSAAPRPRICAIRPPTRSSSSAARCSTSRRSRRSTSAGIQEVRIRSVLTCETTNGVCGKCYGRDLARGTPVNMGEAVGVIAAQSIGEPGTQLTMRTFHIGGAAQISEQSFIESNFDGTIKIRNKNVARNSDGELIAMARNMAVIIVDQDGTERAVHRMQYGARIKVDEGDKIKRGQRIAEWDPYTRPILTEVEGTIGFEDLVEGQSMSEALDESTGIAKRVVIDWRTGSARASGPASGPDHQGQGRQDPQAQPRRRRALPARRRRHHLGRSRRQGEGRRRHRPHPDGERQDARHHRRSAAGGGAVRGASAEGGGDHRRDLRHGAVRPRLQEQAPHHHRADREGRGAARVPDPEGQAHPSAGRRRHREGRLHRRRQSGAARHPGDQGRRGSRRLSGQRDPGGLPAAGRAASTTSTSR